MDYLSVDPNFNSLSLADLLRARDQFHAHLMHKANVVGTAVGRYLIRSSDPYPEKGRADVPAPPSKSPRTLENSEVREYSWPAILVFVNRWEDAGKFGQGREYDSYDFVPSTIFLEDGRRVPVCTVEAPLVEAAPAAVDPNLLDYPGGKLRGGSPVVVDVQGVSHVASLGCLVTDGHTAYVLTSRHVAGEPGMVIEATAGETAFTLGRAADKQLGRLPFERVYEPWPGKHLYLNMDVALIEIEDLREWSASVYGVGTLGPLADLSPVNLSLNLIGCPVRAHGGVSGRLFGQIAALFYRYKSVGGYEYVADFLIGPRGTEPLLTHPGDSGTVWVMESGRTDSGLMPIAVQWGGAVFGRTEGRFPFALATNLSNVCRELNVEIIRSSSVADFEYWGAVGHYTIGALACTQVQNAGLNQLMMANQDRVSFKPADIDTSVNDVSVPGFVPLADVPDKVWKKAKNEAPYGRKGLENPNHYADIDLAIAGQESLDDQTPTAESLDPETWRNYYHAIGFNAVSDRGLLPFRVWQIYRHMVDYVSQQDIASFVAAAGVLAHYVGDACQPLHGSYLADGDPFRDPQGNPVETMLANGKGYGHGVHVAYEDGVLDVHYADVLTDVAAVLAGGQAVDLIEGGRNAGFETIELMRRTRVAIPPMELVNAYGQVVQEGRQTDAPEVLWDQFKDGTVQVIADGCRTLAMLWDSAWAEGQKTGIAIPAAKLVAIDQKQLQNIYEQQDFLPSKALGQIDQELGLVSAAHG